MFKIKCTQELFQQSMFMKVAYNLRLQPHQMWIRNGWANLETPLEEHGCACKNAMECSLLTDKVLDFWAFQLLCKLIRCF
jgi:hypothetical protein